MQNTELKKMLINSGVYEGFLKAIGENHMGHDYNDYPEKYNLTDEEFVACMQLRNSRQQTWCRNHKHIEYLMKMYAGNIYFLTLTFTDDVLARTSMATRRQIVFRLLGAYCIDYLANIDFSPVDGREHYHAVIVPKDAASVFTIIEGGKERCKTEWLNAHSQKYGIYTLLPCGDSDKDKTVLARYIAKLANHSVKVQYQKMMVKRHSMFKHFLRINKRYKNNERQQESRTIIMPADL